MLGPGGTDYPASIVFREIANPPDSLREWMDLPGAPLEYTGINTFIVAEDRKTFDRVNFYVRALPR